MRISDWSSDVCSSDLFVDAEGVLTIGDAETAAEQRHVLDTQIERARQVDRNHIAGLQLCQLAPAHRRAHHLAADVDFGVANSFAPRARPALVLFAALGLDSRLQQTAERLHTHM